MYSGLPPSAPMLWVEHELFPQGSLLCQVTQQDQSRNLGPSWTIQFSSTVRFCPEKSPWHDLHNAPYPY